MSRHFPNWLKAYCEYTQELEAPDNIHFFCGVSAVAAVLQRHVWFPMGFFNWYPNFYVIIVGKAGLITKSTSIDVAVDLCRDVPGVNVGPSSGTWQGLIEYISGLSELVEIDNEQHTMTCATFAPRELGTLIDFSNRELIDVLVDLWDGRTGSWDKMTRAHGLESIVNPWINIVSGTTPSWLAENVPASAIGGGFASRCLFVYGDQKRHFNAYPNMRPTEKARVPFREKLLADLERISLIRGAYSLTPEALERGSEWYKDLWTNTPEHLKNFRLEGYLARKQTHLHKLAMVFAAAQRDEPVITLEDFNMAEQMLTALEDDMLIALDKVGRSKSSISLDYLMGYITQRGTVPKQELTRFMGNIAEISEIDALIAHAMACGLIRILQTGNNSLIQLI